MAKVMIVAEVGGEARTLAQCIIECEELQWVPMRPDDVGKIGSSEVPNRVFEICVDNGGRHIFRQEFHGVPVVSVTHGL